jgi:predicted porin
MEDFSEGKVAAMAATDSSDALSIEPNAAYDTHRTEGGIAYVSPSFNGLTFGIAGYAINNGGKSNTVDTISLSGITTNGSSVASSASATLSGLSDVDVTYLQTSTNLDADAKFDATDIMVEYANGPLLVRVARENIDKKATTAGASGQDQETDSIAISYKMDNITLVGYAFDVENGQGTATNDTDGYFVGAKVAMGANTFGIGYSEETDVDANGTVDSAKRDNESWIVSVDYLNANNYDADAKIDATDIMVEYANGPLLVRVARETIDKKATKAGASGQDQETDSIGISYKMDNITLVGYAFDVENGQGTASNDADGYFVGAKMAMGANTFGIGYSEETDIDSTSGNVDSTKKDNESWMVSVDHALSKRTSLTAAYMDVDDVDANADKSVYAIGLKHVF